MCFKNHVRGSTHAPPAPISCCLRLRVIQLLISCIAFQQRWTVLTTPSLKYQSEEAQQDFHLGSYKPAEKSLL